MPNIEDPRVQRIVSAFDADGFDVTRCEEFEGQTGLMAEHRTSAYGGTGERKRAYYVEGSPRQMGYLQGRLARDHILRLRDRFIEGVVKAFLLPSWLHGAEVPWPAGLDTVRDALVDFLYSLADDTIEDIPERYLAEIKAVADGCNACQVGDGVNWKDLFVINVAFDTLLAAVYTGHLPPELLAANVVASLKLPVLCNAFSVFGAAAGGGHYFGRDFMFPDGGAYQDVASLTIYNPAPSSEWQARPFVSVAAPGIVGSTSAMNLHGLAAGVDMLPGANCSPRKVGLNSLLLVRKAIELGGSAQEAVDIICRSAARRLLALRHCRWSPRPAGPARPGLRR